jgi:hypothetical protein
MTRFIKALIIINGLLVPGVLLVLFVSFLINEFGPGKNGSDPVTIENLITKNGDTLMTQGLVCDNPELVYNSSNLLIKVRPRTYEIPKLRNVNFEGGSYSGSESAEYFVNLFFLDNKYNLISILVNKKASIINITIPEVYTSEKTDTTVKNIGYLISFDDSNNDKRIDSDDNYDLYISDLNGKELIQVTKDIDIQTFEFVNAHKQIFISFKDREDIPEEHKVIRYALYDIKTHELRALTHLDKALNSVQKILNN